MKVKPLLALPKEFEVRSIDATEERVTITAASIQSSASCPLCGTPTSRVHSHYLRHVADLPSGGRQVCLALHVRRFFCDVPACPRKIFAERLTPFVESRARVTARLYRIVQVIGLATGGRLGVRVTDRLGVVTSWMTIIRRIMALPTVPVEQVSQLGIDDFAFRRRRNFGTILVDLQSHQVIDLLPDRTAETAAVIAGIVLLVLGIVVFLLICVIAALNAPDLLASSMLIGLIPFGILSGIGTLVFWLGKRWVARRRDWRIYLYEHGLIYYGQGLYAMHWKSVQSIIHTIVKHTSTSTDSKGHTTRSTSYTHHYKIYCKDGTELAARGVIGGTFKGQSELIQTIEQRSAPYLLGEALHLLKSTGQAPFGALTVSQQGLLVKGNFLPWQELKNFSIGGTAVAFQKKGKWFAWQSCELGDVVNYEVFKQLVSMLRVN